MCVNLTVNGMVQCLYAYLSAKVNHPNTFDHIRLYQFLDCGSPGIPSHGSVTLYNTTAGCEAVFGCDSGYRLVGNATLVCQPNGKWSEMEPTCQRMQFIAM